MKIIGHALFWLGCAGVFTGAAASVMTSTGWVVAGFSLFPAVLGAYILACLEWQEEQRKQEKGAGRG